MLKGSNDTKLIRKNVNEEYIYFFQVWQELVNRFTLDAYQYNILNSLSAFVELEDVLKKTLSGLFNTTYNVECCRDEALSILNKDYVLHKYCLPLVNRVRFHLGKKPDKPHEQRALMHQLSYAIAELSPIYIKLYFDELKKAIDIQNHFDIEKCANVIVSQCMSYGWSARALNDAVRHFFTDLSFDEKWDRFRRSLLVNSKPEHLVFLGIGFKPTKADTTEKIHMALMNSGIVMKTSEEIISEHSDISDISTLLHADKRYIEVAVNATDIYSAAHLSIREVSDMINMVSFYNMISAWDLNSVPIISINLASKFHRRITAEDLYKTYDYVDISGNIFECTRKIFLDSSKKHIQDRLNGAFGYTNISRASLFQEEKFMSLWIALESLARTDMHSDIISSVKEILPAALCIRYIYRIVRNFTEDCSRCEITFDFSARTINMNQPSKQDLVAETISVLQDDVLFPELKTKCEVNQLLHDRCDSVRKLVTDMSYTKEKVENHYRQVKWQIQRLYRIRNEIAHSAVQNNAPLLIYIEHLYDYLSIFITEVVSCLDKKSLYSLEETYCVIKDNYDVFVDLTKDSSNMALIRDMVLKNGIIDMINNQ